MKFEVILTFLYWNLYSRPLKYQLIVLSYSDRCLDCLLRVFCFCLGCRLLQLKPKDVSVVLDERHGPVQVPANLFRQALELLPVTRLMLLGVGEVWIPEPDPLGIQRDSVASPDIRPVKNRADSDGIIATYFMCIQYKIYITCIWFATCAVHFLWTKLCRSLGNGNSSWFPWLFCVIRIMHLIHR